MQQQEQQAPRQPEASSSASASSSSKAPNYNYSNSYNNTSSTAAAAAAAPPSIASSFRGGPYSRTLLDEIREVLAQSYLIFLLADLRLMSGTGRIRTKYETLIIDSDLYSRTTSRNIAGLVEPDPDEFPLPPATLLQPTQSQVLQQQQELAKRGLSPAQIMAILLIELKETFEESKKKRKARSNRRKQKQKNSRKSNGSTNGSENGMDDNDGDDESQDDQFIYYKSDPNNKRQAAEDTMESLLRAYSRMIASDLKVEVPHIRKRRIISNGVSSSASSINNDTNSMSGNTPLPGSNSSAEPVIYMSERNLFKNHTALDGTSLNLESINEDEDEYSGQYTMTDDLGSLGADDLLSKPSSGDDNFAMPPLSATATPQTVASIEGQMRALAEGTPPQIMSSASSPVSPIRANRRVISRRHSNEEGHYDSTTPTPTARNTSTSSSAATLQTANTTTNNTNAMITPRRHSNEDSSRRRNPPTTPRRHSNEGNTNKTKAIHMTGNIGSLHSIHEEDQHNSSSNNNNSNSSNSDSFPIQQRTQQIRRSRSEEEEESKQMEDEEMLKEMMMADMSSFGEHSESGWTTVMQQEGNMSGLLMSSADDIPVANPPGGESTTMESSSYKGDGDESSYDTSMQGSTAASSHLRSLWRTERHANTTNANNTPAPRNKRSIASMRANFSASKRQELAEHLRARRDVLRQQYAERRAQLKQEFMARRQNLRQEFADRIDIMANMPRSPNAVAQQEFQELTTALFENPNNLATNTNNNNNNNTTIRGNHFPTRRHSHAGVVTTSSSSATTTPTTNYSLMRESLGIEHNATEEEIMLVMKRAVESRQYGRLNFMANLFKEGSVSQLMVESSSRIVWMNDWYPLKDLTYAIAVDQKLKRVLVVFRGAITKADWQSVTKYSFTTVNNPVQEDYPGKKKKLKVFSGLYKYLFRTRKDTRTTKYDEVANLAHKYGKEMVGDDYNVAVTGHSLGGALSVFFTLHASTDDRFTSNGPIKCFAFGTPQLGGHNFADTIRHQERRGKLQCVRIFNHNDPVPRLPFNFVVGKRGCRWRHIGIEVSLPNIPWLFGNWNPCIAYAGAKEKNWLSSTLHGYRHNILFHWPWGKPWSYKKMHTLFELQDRLMYGIETKKKGGQFDLFQKTVDELYEILVETDFTTLKKKPDKRNKKSEV